MKLVTTATTADLTIGTQVEFAGRVRTVTALSDTGRPAVFGTGTEWAVTLDATEMAAASSTKWNRV